MGTAVIPPPAVLVAGVLWGDEDALARARSLAQKAFGPVVAQSDPFPFDPFTSYYAREMGDGLFRCHWCFEHPVPRGALAELKLTSNLLEAAVSEGGPRRVNLDPGLLTAESLVLATTKPYSHRIYLGKGIYAEVTLIRRRDGYEPMPWTYPDYRDERTLRFLEGVRSRMLGKKKR